MLCSKKRYEEEEVNRKRLAGTRCAIRVVAEVMTAPGGEREDGSGWERRTAGRRRARPRGVAVANDSSDRPTTILNFGPYFLYWSANFGPDNERPNKQSSKELPDCGAPIEAHGLPRRQMLGIACAETIQSQIIIF